MDGRGEAQWPSPPTVRKREQRRDLSAIIANPRVEGYGERWAASACSFFFRDRFVAVLIEQHYVMD
jgi:hypothetical protein